MMNRISIHRRSIIDLMGINSHDDFHNYLITHAINRYSVLRKEQGKSLGSVLAICANSREAVALGKFPFDKILLTGITGPDKALEIVTQADPRISYQKQNSENISLGSRSFDLVLCKEGLHHLARPVLGLYEMFRITRHAVIVIEPYDTLLGRIFEILRLSSVYENDQSGNINGRNNYSLSLEQKRAAFNFEQLLSGVRLFPGDYAWLAELEV